MIYPQDSFREGLLANMNALEAAEKFLRANKDPKEARQTIQRIMQSLMQSKLSKQYPQLVSSASELIEAPSVDFEGRLSKLLSILRDTVSKLPSQKVKILVVEDDEDLSCLLKIEIKNIHREVFLARSVREAEDILQNNDICLILLDLNLPDSDGRELLLSLRARLATASIPVIILTAKIEAHTKSECFALGADSYFEKPFDTQALLTAVSSKLQQFADISIKSQYDSLTGLLNRRGFYDAFQRTICYYKRTESPLSLALLDLDHFKTVNDSCGHILGDEILCQSAWSLSSALRKTDILSRWGGDEFMIVFPNTPLDKAAMILDRLLLNFRGNELQLADLNKLRITFSAGLAGYRPSASMNEIIREADSHLYRAKNQGRNRIVWNQLANYPLKENSKCSTEKVQSIPFPAPHNSASEKQFGT